MTGVVVVSSGCKGGGNGVKKSKGSEVESQLSMSALLMTTIRKSMVYCRMKFQEEEEEEQVVTPFVDGMDIGWPTEMRHVAHVTFDRFNGFLGLPVELELELQVSCKPPSASASVFGVSAELMQCGFDSKGNSIPIILLLMQERLYSQGGLKAEGIFRIAAENSEEKDLRNQLNKGIIPDDIDLHCLAGLIKAWFRELPEGVLDSLSPAQVLQCETEEDCAELVTLLPPVQFALVRWAIDLMADVVEEEEVNKMNARNIAMVFAPNMTQLSDPLTSLMHAVQVMNLLQTLIFRTLRERDEEEEAKESDWPFSCSPSYDGDDHETDELMESGSDNDREVGASDDLRRDISIDFHSKNAERSIEDCFLMHLELDSKSEGKNAKPYDPVEDEEDLEMDVEIIRNHMDFGDQATKLSCTELSSSVSSIVKSDSNRSTSSRTINNVDSVVVVPEDWEGDAEQSEAVEIIRNHMDFGDKATELSCTELSLSVSSIMKSESNQSPSWRTINNVDSVIEDQKGDTELSDPVEIIRNYIDFGDHVIELCCTELSLSVPSIMKSESNQSTSSRAIDDVDRAIFVHEDPEGDAEPSDPVEDGKELSVDSTSTLVRVL